MRVQSFKRKFSLNTNEAAWFTLLRKVIQKQSLGSFLHNNRFLEISQNSQEIIGVGVSFSIKLQA